MNLSEFKAWFEGFTENMDGPPGEKAWKRILAKIGEITDAPPTTYPVYIDRWVRPYWDRYWGPYYGGIGVAGGGIGMSYTSNSSGGELKQESMLGMQCLNNSMGDNRIHWNSGDAFKELGRAEAKSLS